MKVQDRTITVTGDLAGDPIRMGIDESATAHIMSVLTNLYSDTELAVIREYSTNARDAHIEAGCPERPIEVTTPSPFQSDLVIRDYGIGLSVDDIERIYSQYGASTKRGTNAQTGMLGLGCKSALTYAPSFQVTSWKDGLRIQVVVSMGADNVGIMEVVDTRATDEPNGVEVRIPCQPRNEITEKAETFFSYWEEGTVLLNGNAPEPLDAIELSPEFLIVKRPANGGYRYAPRPTRFVMGGVAYPALEDIDNANRLLDREYYLVVKAPIGSFTFTPSREEMLDNRRTRDYVTDAIKRAQKAVDALVKAELDACATPAEAFAVAGKWWDILSGGQKFRYKGQEIPTQISAPNTSKCWTYDADGYNGRAKNGRGSLTSWQRTWNAAFIANAVLVTGFTADRPSRAAAEKVAQMMGRACDIVYTETAFGDPWVSWAKVVDYDTVKAIKLPRAPRQSTGKKSPKAEPYEYVNDSGYRSACHASDLAGKTLLYASPAEWEQDRGRFAYKLAQSAGATLVIIGKNRFDKFQRDFPDAKPFVPWVSDATQKAYDALSEGAKWIADKRSGSTDYMIVKWLADHKVTTADAEINRHAAFFTKANLAAAAKVCDMVGNAESLWPLYAKYPRPAMPKVSFDGKDTLFRAYPMCYTDRVANPTHYADYIAVIAAKKGK